MELLCLSKPKSLANIRTPGKAVTHIMRKLHVPMWILPEEIILVRYFVGSNATREAPNKFLLLQAQQVFEFNFENCKDDLELKFNP